MYLNQYRLGSKALTTAVQSYAVSGNKFYYDAYMQELKTDKNRDIAWTGLEANDIKDYEWDELREIAALSNNLVPLEEEAMAAVAAGDVASATEFVFGEEYSNTIQKINSLTDEVIDKIQNRLDSSKRCSCGRRFYVRLLFGGIYQTGMAVPAHDQIFAGGAACADY